MVLTITRLLAGKWNGLRLWLALSQLRLRGVKLGHLVYIGRNVSITIDPAAKLILSDGVVIHDDCRLYVRNDATLAIGSNTFVSHHCEITASRDCTIGAECAIAAYCTILDTGKDLSRPGVPWRLKRAICDPVRIEDGVWLGYKATILKGVTVGKHSVVGAGAVVIRDVPAYSLAAGVPARIVRRLSGIELERDVADSTADEPTPLM